MKMRVIDKIAKRKISNSEVVREIVKLVLELGEENISTKSSIRQYKSESGNVEIGIVSEDTGSKIKISIILTNIMSVVLLQLVAYKNQPTDYDYKILTGGYLEEEFSELYLHEKGMNNTYNSILKLGLHEPSGVLTFGDLFLPKQ
jgi:hypothetical protein